MVIDTLRTVKRLREAGFTEEQAEVLTDLIVCGHESPTQSYFESPEKPVVNSEQRQWVGGDQPPATPYRHQHAYALGSERMLPPGAIPAAAQTREAGETQGLETRLVKWVIPLMLGQGVLVWGLAQIF